MKVLLDEHLPHALRYELPEHEVFTVKFMGWCGIKNGSLLTRAAEAAFDAFVTNDRGIPHEQNTSALPLAVVVLHAKSNRLRHVRELLPKLLQTLNHVTLNSLHHVS